MLRGTLAEHRLLLGKAWGRTLLPTLPLDRQAASTFPPFLIRGLISLLCKPLECKGAVLASLGTGASRCKAWGLLLGLPHISAACSSLQESSSSFSSTSPVHGVSQGFGKGHPLCGQLPPRHPLLSTWFVPWEPARVPEGPLL